MSHMIGLQSVLWCCPWSFCTFGAFGTLDVIPKRMRITFFNLGELLGLQNTFSITRGFLKRCGTITAKIYIVSSSNRREKQLASSSWSAMASTTTWWRYLKGYVVEFPESVKCA
jgi:hypothetical protein